MYLMKEKYKISLYKSLEPKFPNHKDLELQAHLAYTIGNDMSDKMQSTIRGMARMIIQGFSEGVN